MKKKWDDVIKEEKKYKTRNSMELKRDKTAKPDKF